MKQLADSAPRKSRFFFFWEQKHRCRHPLSTASNSPFIPQQMDTIHPISHVIFSLCPYILWQEKEEEGQQSTGQLCLAVSFSQLTAYASLLGFINMEHFHVLQQLEHRIFIHIHESISWINTYTLRKKLEKVAILLQDRDLIHQFSNQCVSYVLVWNQEH